MRATVEAEYALLFDCDGVIVETEVTIGCMIFLIICLNVRNSFLKTQNIDVINVEDESTF